MGRYSLTTAEVDLYSIVYSVQSGLDANGWNLSVKKATNGWPTSDEITPPVVYIGYGRNAVAGIELGSNGKSREVFAYIYAANDPQRMSLAEEITDMFRDGVVAIHAFTTGNESTPAVTGWYEVDEVSWRPLTMPSNATDVDKWRATVSAVIRRAE